MVAVFSAREGGRGDAQPRLRGVGGEGVMGSHRPARPRTSDRSPQGHPQRMEEGHPARRRGRVDQVRGGARRHRWPRTRTKPEWRRLLGNARDAQSGPRTTRTRRGTLIEGNDDNALGTRPGGPSILSTACCVSQRIRTRDTRRGLCWPLTPLKQRRPWAHPTHRPCSAGSRADRALY